VTARMGPETKLLQTDRASEAYVTTVKFQGGGGVTVEEAYGTPVVAAATGTIHFNLG